MSREQLDKFLRLLKAAPSGAVFNPWWQIDDENDIGPTAPAIRRKQLRAYLQERLAKHEVRDRRRSAWIPWGSFYRNPHDFGAPAAPEEARNCSRAF